MTDGLATLETMVGAQLAKEALPTTERIRELIEQVRALPFCSDVTPDQAEALALQFEARHGVTMTIGSVLKEPDFEPWLDDARKTINPYYWDRYRKLLAQQGFSGDVLATLDSVTDRILGLLQNPEKAGPWDRRGMVVGHVQSGKTANYTGLICKAADAGYRLIVVIAGVHNNLRNQTQLRIDEGFVGRDSARLLANRDEQFVGVGRFDNSRRPVTFTNSLRDFNKQMATGVGVPLQNLNEPAVFVIKKNPNTLKNLLEWLREHSARLGSAKVDAPMLLIDDEADNASINTRHGRGEVTRINGQLRDLLKTFERSCYVGYTATPFANIFIDPDSDDEMLGEDLFPRDFIVSLDPPSNYFGANRVFIDDPRNIIRHIEDNEERLPVKHSIDFQLTALPPSLLEAIRTFVTGRAIRLLRGQHNAHSSMLVNASIKNEVQRQIRNAVHNELSDLQAAVRIHAGLPSDEALRNPVMADLHDTWRREFAAANEFDWPDVQSALNEAIAPIRTVLINSKSADVLDYAGNASNGLNVIAVGGFSLSRGLTLEGLTVSYFLRNSMMYDTLMQMGRWFGYRPGYDDLCRIWMPEEAEGWYAHIAEAVEELREELRQMQSAGATPRQFGLKVRSHPDTLIVTARNKMGSGEKHRVAIGLGNKFIETAILRRDPDSLDANRQAVRRLVDRMSDDGTPITSARKEPGGWLIQGIGPGPIEDFVSEFRNHEASLKTEPGPVRRYIEERRDGELEKWDVLFASIKQSNLVDESLGLPIQCQRRAEGKRSNTSTLFITNKQRVASRGVEKTGLTSDQIEQAEANYRENHAEPRSSEGNYPDWIYRSARERPLLIVHHLAIGEEGDDFSGQLPVVAYSISFPQTALEERRVEYVVNTTWWKENYRDEMDEEEMAGDED
jgi:hypothetical protein